MKSLIGLIVVCLLASCSPSPSPNVGPSPPGLSAAPLRAIQISATPDQRRQIVEAVQAFPLLAEQLERLEAAGHLVAIIVQSTPMRPFGARVDGSRMMFSAEFLNALKTKPLFDVVYPDDILPNNTVFALGHLAYHLGAPPIRPADQGGMQAYVLRKLVQEAFAFAQGWNDVVDAATHQNGGRPLSPRQSAQLLMNMRYRFAFLKAIQQNTHKLRFAEGGYIRTDSNNMSAIATALSNSQMTDIE